MQIFDRVTLEGLVLLEKRLISGFNLEDDEFLNVISLNLKYYHNSFEHIQFLIEILNEEVKKRFNKGLKITNHKKVGIFRWEKYFDNELGNEYFIVERKKGKLEITPISYPNTKEYRGSGFIIVRDYSQVLDLLISEGKEGEFLYQFLREKCSKKIFRDNKLVDNPVIDERCQQIPLFTIKDIDNLIEDKSGIVEVVNLKFIKEDKTLQSLIKPKELKRILTKFGTFECEFKLEKENRYVSLEFNYYM